MEGAVVGDERRMLGTEHSADGLVAGVGGAPRIQALDGIPQPGLQHDLIVRGPLREMLARRNHRTVGNLVPEATQPFQCGFFQDGFRDHTCASTIFSASRMRSSPERSLGRRASRISARVWFCSLLARILRMNDRTMIPNFSATA